MTTYNTGNPVPSTAVKDLYDNSQTEDEVVNSDALTTVTRTGKLIQTFAGMQDMVTDFLINMGFEATHLIYVDGVPLQVDRPTQLIDRAGSVYKVKMPATFPVNLTGTWATDQLLLIDVGDASLRTLLASPDGAKHVFDGARSVHEALLATPYTIAPGDGVADDASKLVAALAASNHISFPKSPNGYAIKSNVSVTLTSDTVIDFNGQPCSFTNGRITLSGQVVATGRTLAANAARYATQLTFNSTTGIQAGDLIYINTSIAPSPDWADTKKDCCTVKLVTGPLVDLLEPINFSYATADAGLTITVYRPAQLTLLNADLRLIADDADTTPYVMIDAIGLRGVEVDSPRILGQKPFNRSTNIYRVGIQTIACVQVRISNANYESMSYGVGIYGATRDIQETNTTAAYMHHAHADCGDWSSDYVLRGLQSSDCYQSLNTHPVFRAHASDFYVKNDFGMQNWRCVGGGLRNGVAGSLVGDAAELPQFQNIPMNAGFEYLYTDADFYCRDVDFRMPFRVNQPQFGVRFGRTLSVGGSKMNDIWASFGGRGQLQEMIIEPGNRIGPNGVRTPGKLGVFCTTRIDLANDLDAKLISGVYHVDPRAAMVQHSMGRLACRGAIVSGSAVNPTVVTVRFHVNAFSDAEQANVVSGVIKFFATVYHQNSGKFSTQERHFNFCFNVAATSTMDMPLVPVYSSALSGQPNESIAIAIAAPGFSGVSQIGANGDHFFEVPVTVSSGRTAPIYNLSYAFEMLRGA